MPCSAGESLHGEQRRILSPLLLVAAGVVATTVGVVERKWGGLGGDAGEPELPVFLAEAGVKVVQ